ncbi:hypothetical protein ACN4EK_11825 [Pantanalinema rosaneae CENA516]|uniref:hypothetical protein n=1 Tax=Pantanalinema rosaneae TaxID=1620701 RepID=UPI003D6EEEB2
MLSCRWLTYACRGLAGMATVILSTVGAIAPGQAEGSRSLFPNPTGFRANLEWRTGQYNLLTRRTLLRVYARQGEVILLGSSAMGVNNGDILVFDPGVVPFTPVGQEVVNPAAAAFQCSTQNALNPAQGVISNRTQELAGPDTVPAGGVANGYTPCVYQAPTTGFYTVAILGPAGANTDNDTPPTGSLDPIQTGVGQDATVAAWDVTVRTNLVSPANLPGRLLTYYLSLFTGANGRPIDSTVYILTSDGFLYETGLRGIDPNGFVVYGNRVGFLDADGRTPLNRDVVASDNLLNTVQGGVIIAPPEYPLFFSPPDPEVVAALGIPLTTTIPAIAPGSYSFTGTAGSNNSLVATGGNFAYSANVPHVYELIISQDGSDFDPTNPQNRVLRGIGAAGTQTVTWDGLDNSGTPFPIGTNYPARLVIRAGEYHFPLLDVENSLFGSPTYRLLNPPGGICPPGFAAPCTSAFYDDRGYRTSNGSIVGTVNQPLPGGAPTPPNSNLITGFDTTSGARAFSGFGDQKGLDLWTYYPSEAVLTPLNIVASAAADLRLAKTVDRPNARVGETVTFTITLTNDGPATATNVVVRERLAEGLTFVAATASQGTYDPNTGAWTVASIPNGSNATLQVTAILTQPAVTNVAEVIASDQPDPNSTPNNNQPDENDQAQVVLGAPSLRLVKRITAIVRRGDRTPFNTVIDDPNDPNDTVPGWATLPPVGTPRIDPTTPLRSGDEVEYTIYFLADGGVPVTEVSLCDQIPPGARFVPASSRVAIGTDSPIPDGAVFSPLAPLPSENGCRNQTNPNGSVIFNLGTISNLAPNNVGFVRFRVRIN